MVSFESEKDFNIAYMMMMRVAPRQSFHSSEETFGGQLPFFDIELWAGMVTQLSPIILDMPAFEELSMVCDPRPVTELLSWTREHCPETPPLPEKAQPIQTVPFEEFCRRNRLDLSGYKIPDVMVETVGADIPCPLQKRLLVSRQCAYGAPVGMYRLRYSKNRNKPHDFLATVFREALDESNQIAQPLERLHAQLLETTEFKALFAYNARHESLSVNGEHLVKFVPAKMLRKILKAYTMSGQTEFTYRDFSYDTEVVSHHKGSNIDVRFTRLCKLLDAKFPYLALKKTGRGKIILKISCRIEYREE
jgi:hypothetical protein